MPNITLTLPAVGEEPWGKKILDALIALAAAINNSASGGTPQPLGPAAVSGDTSGPLAAAGHVHPTTGLATTTDLENAILGAGTVPATREVATGTGLTGGGTLEQDREIAVVFGTTPGTVCEGDDPRIAETTTITAPGGSATLVVAGTLPPTVAATNITATADDQASGPLVKYLTTAASGVDAGVLTHLGAVQARWAPRFRARVMTDASAITNTRLVVGLVSAEVAADAGPASTGAYTVAEGVWFRYDTSTDTTSFWRCVTGGGANATVITTTVAIAANTSYELAIDINAAGTSVEFRINGTVAATHTTNLPGSSTALGTTARLRTLAASARALRLGRLAWSQL